MCAWGQAAKHLANVKQITQGGQNAEAYWAPDGKRLIFQATRDTSECDQQYIMNADGSDMHMVSTGKGVTTCGYFLPDNKHIVYASTHEAGPSCPARPDRSKGYLWAVYPGFDIYLADDKGKIEKKLTDAAGYDAEATINFKNKKIIYTSMASGDLDLWTMNLDGSGKKQITKTEGYDGGAVFSRDGSKMAWRAYHPDTPKNKDLPGSIEGKPDGSHEDGAVGGQRRRVERQADHQLRLRQLRADLHAGRQEDPVLIQQAKCDSRDFELYTINLDGTGLEQVTSYGGFTSFPEFSPDGKKIVFVSSYQSKSDYEFNVFTADWK